MSIGSQLSQTSILYFSIFFFFYFFFMLLHFRRVQGLLRRYNYQGIIYQKDVVLLNVFDISFCAKVGEPLEEAGYSATDIDTLVVSCGSFLDFYVSIEENHSRERRSSSSSIGSYPLYVRLFPPSLPLPLFYFSSYSIMYAFCKSIYCRSSSLTSSSLSNFNATSDLRANWIRYVTCVRLCLHHLLVVV